MKRVPFEAGTISNYCSGLLRDPDREAKKKTLWPKRWASVSCFLLLSPEESVHGLASTAMTGVRNGL